MLFGLWTISHCPMLHIRMLHVMKDLRSYVCIQSKMKQLSNGHKGHPSCIKDQLNHCIQLWGYFLYQRLYSQEYSFSIAARTSYQNGRGLTCTSLAFYSSRGQKSKTGFLEVKLRYRPMCTPSRKARGKSSSLPLSGLKVPFTMFTTDNITTLSFTYW